MRNRRSRWIAAPLALGVALVLAGCTQAQLQGWMPSTSGLTNHVDRIMGLWTTSWIVLLLVGLVTWGLMIWAAIAYRRRKGQTGLPVLLADGGELVGLVGDEEIYSGLLHRAAS